VYDDTERRSIIIEMFSTSGVETVGLNIITEYGQIFFALAIMIILIFIHHKHGSRK